MYSGKTEELIRLAKRATFAHKKKIQMFHKRVKGETTVNPLNADPSLVTSLEDNIFETRCRNCFDK